MSATLAPDVRAALDELLEAERAGARAAREMAEQMNARMAGQITGQIAAAPITELIHAVQQGELKWCRMLMGHLTRLGETPSALTGDFWAKVMAEQTLGARLALLNRGQAWVVRKLDALLPRVTDAALADDLRAMRDAHTEQIARVESALESGGAEPAPPSEPAALVAHITARFHDVHRNQLPRLVALAEAAEASNGDHAPWPAALPGLLRTMEGELLMHMIKEERILFPMLARGGHPFAAQPIGVMRHEHADHEATLDELTAMVTPAPDANADWRALAAEWRVFESDLRAHIALENEVLFPPFEHTAPPPQAPSASDSRQAVFTIRPA